MLRSKIFLRIVAELLGQDQDAVERCAQLVRHVGEKFRLVLRCESQLASFFLERDTRLLDLGVLSLDLGILLGKQRRFRGQLFVGLLKLLLAGLQLCGQPLRLLEQRRLGDDVMTVYAMSEPD